MTHFCFMMYKRFIYAPPFSLLQVRWCHSYRTVSTVAIVCVTLFVVSSIVIVAGASFWGAHEIESGAYFGSLEKYHSMIILP